MNRHVNLPMPLPAFIQTGGTALVAPVVTDSFWEWLGVLVANGVGWGCLFVVLLLMARDDA